MVQSLDELVARETAAHCKHIFHCCDLKKYGLSPDIKDEPSCNAELTRRGASDLAAQKQSLAAGRFAFDATKADSCIQTLESASCSDFFGTSAGTPARGSCLKQATTPLVAAGGACASQLDCSGRCDVESTPKVCRAQVAANMPCSNKGFECDQGLFCPVEGVECHKGQGPKRCVSRQADGASCCTSSDCKSGTCYQWTCESVCNLAP